MSATLPMPPVSHHGQFERDRFFDLSLDMLCVIGSDGYFVQVNPAWTHTLGWSADELLSRPFIEFVYVDDRVSTLTVTSELLKGKPFYKFENRYHHKDGSIRWLWWSGVQQPNEKLVVAVARDVTEQKQTELREATRTRTLSALASSASLPDVLGILIRGVETEHPGALSSVMLLDSTGKFLQAGMAPSLPDFYNKATHNLPIGPAVGTCGTAAFTGHRVITPNIQTDPAWTLAKELAAQAGLAACCSQPILDRNDRVVGTCALYRSHVHTPTDGEIATLEAAAQLAAIAIERKNQEQAVRDSEANYRRIIETTTEGIWTIDETARITFVNRQLATMLGYKPEEMLGKMMFEFVDEETRKKFYQRMERRRQGISESYDYKFQHRDGHDVWTHISASPLLNSSGHYSGAMAMVTDISERRIAQDELHDKQRFLESITATSPDVMYLYDPKQQRHLYINRDLKALTGYDNQEILNGDVNLVLHNAHPEDLPRVMAHMRAMATMSSDEIVTLEYRIKLDADQIMWMQVRERIFARDDQQRPTVIFGIVQDITDRKGAEEAVREREHYLDKIINNIGDPVFVKDNDSKFVLVNDAFCGFFEMTRHDIIGQTLSDDLPPEQIQKALEVDRRVLDEGSDVTDESAFVKDGRVRIIYSKKTRYIDDAGNRFLIGVIHDLTQSKRMEDALRGSEARLQGIFSAMAEGVVVQGMDGRVVECNRAAEEILGLSGEQMLGRQYFDPRWRAIHEDGSPFSDENHPAMVVLRAGKPQHNVIMGVHKPDESLAWISINAVPLHGFDGAMIGVVVTFSNITASVLARESLKQSEASLAAAQSRAKIGSWELNLATQSGSWSAELYRIFGRNPKLGVPLPEEFIEMIHPDDRDAYGREFRRALAERNGIHAEVRIMRPNGKVRWIESRSEFIFDERGHPAIMMGTTQDITERHQLEAQFRQAQKMEAIGTLAGGIAHDFNNILAAVKGYTQLAKTDVKDRPDVQEHLDAVLQGTLRATELVKQITTFSRQHEAQRSSLQLHKIVAEALALIRATIPATIKIESTLDRKAPSVLADATQIHQIVMNLCTNAWHAMKAKPGQLSVGVDQVLVDAKLAKQNPDLQSGNYVRLTVKDTGVGMDQATLARIFEPFFTTKPPGEGSGLGLAVVHGIVRSHHGAIIVSSTPQVGTQFELYFPALAVSATKDTQSVQQDLPQGRGERILLVDDEPSLIQLGTRVLERMGYAVKPFVSSHDAMAALRAAPHEFDLVITDLSMPGMSGLDLAKELRQLRPSMPIIVVSGHIDVPAQERIASLGIQRVLSKPFALESLGIAVNQVLTNDRKH